MHVLCAGCKLVWQLVSCQAALTHVCELHTEQGLLMDHISTALVQDSARYKQS